MKSLVLLFVIAGLCAGNPATCPAGGCDSSSTLPPGLTVASVPAITSLDVDIVTDDPAQGAPQARVQIDTNSTVFPQDAPPEFGELIPEPSFGVLVLVALSGLVAINRYNARHQARPRA